MFRPGSVREKTALTVLWLLLPLTPTMGLGAAAILDPARLSREFTLRSWQKQDGLPDNQVQAIHQTRDGYLWIATRRGVARFDGQRFVVFDRVNTPAMTDEDCRELLEDGLGNFWVGAAQARYQYTGNQAPTFVRRSELDRTNLHALCGSRAGGLWGANRGVIARIKDGIISEFHVSPSVWNGDDPTALAEDKSGVVWLGLNGGVLRFDPSMSLTAPCYLNREFQTKPIRALAVGASNTCWMLISETHKPLSGPNRGWLACLNGTNWVRTPKFAEPDFYFDSRSYFLVKDHTGAWWLPAAADTLHRYQDGEFQTVAATDSGRNDFALCVYPDREGNLWIGNESSGLECWEPRRVSTFTTRDGLPNDNIWSITEAGDGSVWVGSDGGVTRIQAGRITNFTEQQGLTKNTVRSLAVDRAGTVWIGTGDRLNTLHDGKIAQPDFPYLPERTKIRVVLAASDDSIWMGNIDGLHRWRDGRWTSFTVTNGLANQDVRALLEDHQGNLWIGTAGGGMQCLRDGRFTTFSTTNGLVNNFAWALHEDSSGAIWIGTEGGLSRWQGGRIFNYTTRHGLPVNLVNFIVEDDFDRLWIGHDRGLYWVRRDNLNAVAAGQTQTLRCVSYDESDGLPGLETNGQKSYPAACKTRDGRLWFSTTKGVAIIDPRKVGRDDNPPLAAIEQVRANGTMVFGNRADTVLASSTNSPARHEAFSTLHFSPGTARVLEFHYTANTFVEPEKARFKYRLRGLSDAWVEADTRREAYFAELRPGDYEFEVIAANHHGVWQEPGAALAFHIAPFFYQTWWFYPLGGGAVLALLIAVVMWRLREVRKMHRLEQRAAITEERSRIAKDLHDGLGADLTRLTLLADLASGEAGDNGGEHARKLSRTSRDATRELKDLIWMAHPANDTVEGLVTRICQTAEDFLRDARIKCRLDLAPTLPTQVLSLEQRRNLLLVAREALNNIVKHASATEVYLRARASHHAVQLTIEDNGRGFDAALARRDGLGLDSMRRRVESLGGTFDLESRPGSGTKILISIKLG